MCTIRPELEEAIRQLKDDRTPLSWVLGGYEDKSIVGLIAQGEGGLSELMVHLRAEDVCYGLMRQSFTFEKVGSVQADTVKFIFIYWRPENIPISRKMKIGVFEGQIKRLFSPYHADLDVATFDELNEQVISNLLNSVTMRGSRVTEAKATDTNIGGRTSLRKERSARPNSFLPTGTSADTSGAAAGAAVSFDDPTVLREAVEDVRNDETATNWCLFGYTGKRAIGYIARGEGGFEEMEAAFQEANVNYGLLRVTEKYDLAETVRFAFIVWQPEDVPPTKRALISTHKGSVTTDFRPYMCEFTITARGELTTADILSRIGGLTGTRSHVTERKAEEKKEDKYERKMLGGLTQSVETLEFEDETALREAIRAVRTDACENDWVVAKFVDSRLVFSGTGTGSWDALVGAFDHNSFNYALLRLHEDIDRSTTTKFCYVRYQPDSVPAQVRGRLGALSGSVGGVFHPFHGDVTFNDCSECSLQHCLQAVAKK